MKINLISVRNYVTEINTDTFRDTLSKHIEKLQSKYEMDAKLNLTCWIGSKYLSIYPSALTGLDNQTRLVIREQRKLNRVPEVFKIETKVLLDLGVEPIVSQIDALLSNVQNQVELNEYLKQATRRRSVKDHKPASE
jgi:hypothetical protein